MASKTKTTTLKTKKNLPQSAFKTDQSYLAFLKKAKEKVKSAQIKAALAVNSEMLIFYWELGCMMLEQQRQASWGDKWIDQFSTDLRESFPDQSGFSRTNLHYMRKFAETYPDFSIVQQVVGQLPWGQNILLLSISDPQERLWYADKAIDEGWVREDMLKALPPEIRDYLPTIEELEEELNDELHQLEDVKKDKRK